MTETTGTTDHAGPGVHPPITEVRAAVERALAEDLTPLGDVTSALLPAGLRATAEIVPRAAGVLAGRLPAAETFASVDAAVAVEWRADDGDPLAPGQALACLEGPLASILTAERTALNFLGHLSGIATLTRRFVDAASPVRVWDTRKTTPGLRALEKAAVRAGGGVNHRGNLTDWVLLKDNHLALLGITEAVRRARARWPARTVQVECDTVEQLHEAIEAGADLVMLDNMTPEQVRECVALNAGRALLEISGGITLETVRGYADTGADLVSTGSITNSAPVLDIGLDVRV
jgi:nicotinate-nucleotide pyrophosphorylase (carboxylating)